MNKLFLILLLFISVETYAKCEGEIISKIEVAELSDSVVFKDIIKKFGTGCLGGKDIVNTVYRETNGGSIYFFLKNKPKKASELLKENKAANIEIYMAVFVDLNQKSKEVIWPKKLTKVGYKNALKKEYFGTNKKCSPATIQNTSIYDLNKDKLNVKEAIDTFGMTCFSGFTALTLQYLDENGLDIWFWLSNKPKPAIQSIKSNQRNNIDVFMIVQKNNKIKNSEKIIWPVSLKDKPFDKILTKEYFPNAEYHK